MATTPPAAPPYPHTRKPLTAPLRLPGWLRATYSVARKWLLGQQRSTKRLPGQQRSKRLLGHSSAPPFGMTLCFLRRDELLAPRRALNSLTSLFSPESAAKY